MSEERSELTQSVARVFALLESLGQAGGEAGLTELSAAVSLTPSTMHRLLRTLVMLGYVRRLPSRRYALGPALIRLGEQATQLIATWARPSLEALEEAEQETANLAVLDGDMVVYVAQVPSRHRMRMFTEVGRRVYPHSTGVGKAILAELPDEVVRAQVRRTGMPGFTPHTIVDEERLLDDLRQIRSRGFAIDDGEQELGVRCFAVAVPGSMTPTAVSVSGPTTRMTSAAVPALLRAAGELARLTETGQPHRGEQG